MVGGNVNAYPIVLLVNYWEHRFSSIGAKLDDLLQKGVTQLGSFVPWQVAESDITHVQSLTRFLQAAADRRMKVFLILTPEVGLHYQYSGLPRDLVARTENRAQHCQSGQALLQLPPCIFSLPSFFAPEFSKRYYSFMGRLEGLFTDLQKSQPGLLKDVVAITTGSFWKYYRSPLVSSQSPFAGAAGDYNSHATQAFRQRTEQYFAQREFSEPTPSAANQWKTRSLEELNRRWFYQQSEDIFRARSHQTLRKRASWLPIWEVEMYTPEADPSLVYSSFLQNLSGGTVDVSGLSSLLDEASCRASAGAAIHGSPAAPQVAPQAAPMIHWTSMGGFKGLPEPDRQFLILKSLLLLGGQGGAVAIDETEWFRLSSSFRNRAEALAQTLFEKQLRLKSRILYLGSHLWSGQSTLWDEVLKRSHPHARLVTSIDQVFRDREANLLIVDPTVIIKRETVQKLTSWAKAGRVVVLPRGQFYTEQAKRELDKAVSGAKKIEVDMGLTYRLYSQGEGKLIVYDAHGLPHGSLLAKGEPLASWQTFIQAVFSIAEVDSYCRVTDGRLSMISLQDRKDNLAVFVLNETRRKIMGDLVFNRPVKVGDLGVIFTNGKPKPSFGQSKQADESLSTRFTLEVPPFGVLPLSVGGLDLNSTDEKYLAATISKETEESAMSAALGQLPGFDPVEDRGIEELWS